VHEDLPWVKAALMILRDAGAVVMKRISIPAMHTHLMLASAYERSHLDTTRGLGDLPTEYVSNLISGSPKRPQQIQQ
jgi:hypothetical protein